MFRRKVKIFGIFFGIIILLIIVLLLSQQDKTAVNWQVIRASSDLTLPEPWRDPVRLAVSEDGAWMDSLYVDRDGQRIYFMYYPGDLLSDIERGRFISNGKTYFSEYPFTEKKVADYFFLAEPEHWSAAGVYIDKEGNYFYHSNRPPNAGKGWSNIYRNDVLLEFNDEQEIYSNPHYCSLFDELWFDRNDHEIYVLYNAEANNFGGTPSLAPRLINYFNERREDGAFIKDFQPWLSEDCQTIYFTSTRQGLYPAIYKAERKGENWNVPSLVVSSNFGVGEPTLTQDMQQLFFVQVLVGKKGNYMAELYMSSRENKDE